MFRYIAFIFIIISGCVAAVHESSTQIRFDPIYTISDRGNTHQTYRLSKRAVVHNDINGERLASLYPECKQEYENNCSFDEIQIPCTNLCWRICPANKYWDEAETTCKNIPNYSVYWVKTEEAIRGCKRLNENYRLPTLEEATSIVGDCHRNGDIRCNSYHDSAAYYIVDVSMYFDYPVDRPGRCTDAYGAEVYGCSWIGRLNGGDYILPSEFTYLRFGGTPGGAAVTALCVREL